MQENIFSPGPEFREAIVLQIVKLRDRIELLLRGKKEKELSDSWHNSILDGLSTNDRKSILRIRSLLSDKNQNWYYSGSGSDMLPTIISEEDSTHVREDIGYNSACPLFHESFDRDHTHLFEKLGASVEARRDWSEAWIQAKQVLTIDGEMKIILSGKKTEEHNYVEDSIDVVYTNLFSTTPGPDVIRSLRVGGFYVDVTSKSKERNQAHLRGTKIEDIGFEYVETISLNKAHFPKVGKIAGTTDGKSLDFHIYRKSQEMNDLDYQALRAKFDYHDLYSSFAEFVFDFDFSNEKQETKKYITDSFERAAIKYLETIIFLMEVGGTELANHLLDSLKVFISGIDFPDDDVPYPYGDQARQLVVDKFKDDVRNNYLYAKEFILSSLGDKGLSILN